MLASAAGNETGIPTKLLEQKAAELKKWEKTQALIGVSHPSPDPPSPSATNIISYHLSVIVPAEVCTCTANLPAALLCASGV